VLQQALHDADPDVRLMAVSSAGSDPQGQALLREALEDSNENVRTLASMKLTPPPEPEIGQ
jgi:HEAT repeats